MQRVAEHQGQPYFEDAIAAPQAHVAGDYKTDEELADLYRRESVLFASVGADLSEHYGALATAGTNADALRHFNEHVAGAMDLRAGLGKVPAPTLALTGDSDPMGAPAAQELLNARPNGRLEVLPRADHFPFLDEEHCPRWSRTVLEFL
jgi:pimeloyl-ACP methyl ester carboxylesterase